MAQRKLQTDVVKTIKRVTEGVEAFETLFTKMEASTNSVQKEKCETDLKTQIKKLQRLRDQIKTWIASSEIKDKEPLTETRKLIETQMERFKALEKEMKTKAFSKEGLIAATKLDPAEKAKLDANHWLSSMIDELSRQIEQAEAEVELLAASQGKKKGKGAGGERVGELERLNERRKWHVGRMELVQRMLDNGGIPLDKVLATKEDISYFVESNTEEDFEEDEGIYDDLDLQEDDDQFGGMGEKDDILSSHDSQSLADEVSEPVRTPAKSRTAIAANHHDEDSSNSSGALARKTSLDDASTSPSTKKTPVRKTTLDAKSEALKAPPVPSPNFTQQPMSSALKAGLPSNPTTAAAARPPAAAPLPAIRYAAAAAAAVAPPTPTLSIPSPAPAPSPAQAAPPSATESLQPPIPSPTTESFSAPSPPPSHLSTVSSPRSSNAAPQQPTLSPVPSTADLQKQQDASRTQQPKTEAPPSLNNLSELSSVPSSANGAPSPQPPSQQQPQQPFNSSAANVSPLPPHATHPSEVSPSPQAQRPGSTAPLQSIGHAHQQQQQQLQQQPRPGSRNEGQRLPNALTDLVSSFENAKQRSASRTGNMDQMHSALDASFHALPHPTDAEKPRNYVPKNPMQNPPHYPQEPFAGFQDPALYPKMDLDTLFYIFYYHAGTYEQWLAARELKKQSWRFHKQYLTWFQRLSQPQAITDDYEQGMYIYFDWENSWCQRKKADFRFEYRYLSEDA